MAIYNFCGASFLGGVAAGSQTQVNTQGVTTNFGQPYTSGTVRRRRFKMADLAAAVLKATNGTPLASGDQILLLPVSAGEVVRFGGIKVITAEVGATTLTCSVDIVAAAAGVADNTVTVNSSSTPTMTPGGALVAAGKDLKVSNTYYTSQNEAGNAFAGSTNVLESLGIVCRVNTALALTLTFTGTPTWDGEIILGAEVTPLFV